MIGIVDYGVGNLFSVQSSLRYLGRQAELVTDAKGLARAERIILPGVGAFAKAAQKLERSGLAMALLAEAASGKPLLGICLGMQLLFAQSREFGLHRGLGLIPGTVAPIAPLLPPGLKTPQIGWNALSFPAGRAKSRLFCQVEAGEYVYFVHSYQGTECTEAISATTEYGITITAAVECANVYGCQFHPEKSGPTGLNILSAFCAI